MKSKNALIMLCQAFSKIQAELLMDQQHDVPHNNTHSHKQVTILTHDAALLECLYLGDSLASTSFTGSAPGDSMKKIGVVFVESS